MTRYPIYIAVCLFLVILPLSLALLLAPRSERLTMAPVAYSALPGWDADGLVGFDTAFMRSCEALLKMSATRRIGPEHLGLYARDFKPACHAAEGLHGAQLRAAIEAHFTPHAVSLKGKTKGLFTGYYEPILEGAFERSAEYDTPLYGLPSDLVSADLGAFRAELAGTQIRGRVVGRRFVPYEDRAEIEDSGLGDRAEPILYLRDPVAAFFLHIQGSGRVRLRDGSLIGVGYAGQNGHDYVPIGRVLRQEGHLPEGGVSLQSIRAWLHANPDERDRILQANPSFIFFRILEEGGPFGSAGVGLTPERSLAVDRRHLALHLPVFLATQVPSPGGEDTKFERLMIAQDTGGAIKGEIRGDVFWGAGERAEYTAGHMASAGRYWVLLPNARAASR